MMENSILKCLFSTKNTAATHFHQDIEILYVLDGTLCLEMEGAETTLSEDTFCLVNSNVRHSYHGSGNILTGSILIDHARLSKMFPDTPLFFFCDSTKETLESYQTLRLLIRQIFHYFLSEEGSGALLYESFSYHLLYILTSDFRIQKGMQKYETLYGNTEERTNEILEYILLNYKEPITLLELSKHLHLTHSYAARYFKQHFGMTFLTFLTNVRLDYAVNDLLYTDKKILRIALDNGFPNLASFNKKFRDMYRMSPGEYRLEKEAHAKPEDTEYNSAEVLAQVESRLENESMDAPDTLSTTVTELNGKSATELHLHKPWKKLVHIGDASELLRYDVREQLKLLSEKLGFQYVWITNLFSSSMKIQLLDPDIKYNFSELDNVLNYIIQLNMHPYIELESTASYIYGHIDENVLKNNARSHLAYLSENTSFLKKLLRHWVHKYGMEEISQWYISLEQSNARDNTVEDRVYIAAFQSIARCIKSQVPDIRIGGPGFTINSRPSRIQDLLALWESQPYRPDFISLYVFPYIQDSELLEAGRNHYSSDKNYLLTTLSFVRDVMKCVHMEDPEIHVSLWNYTLSSRNTLNDSCFKAAYTMRNLLQNWKHAGVIGCWNATDIQSNDTDSVKPLFGGPGLISRNGIYKPVYYAYRFLNMLFPYVIAQNEYAAVTWDGQESLVICCHNYKHFNYRYYLLNENDITMESQGKLFEDHEKLQIVINIRGLDNGDYQIRELFINNENGNIQREWKKIGYYEDLSNAELEYLKARSQPGLYVKQVAVTDHLLHLEASLAAQEIRCIQVEKL